MAAGGGKEMEIAIKIAGKVESSFKNALSQATKGLGSITKTVASATAAAAAAVGAMGIAAINTGREFEGAMSQVAATMLIDKTTAEGQKAFETLENAARECGASTAFSATEAAEALNYLALAGYDADKAATALPTVLKLAGAGAMDLASASDMITDSMSALGLEATEANLTTFADQMAQTASKANTSVSQLGEAILTVGGTAKYLSGGTTELNMALGLLADNGIKGSEGGTKLRNMIMSLTAPTDNASAALGELGVSVFDAQGNMRDLQSIFGDLNTAMAGMTTEQQASYLSTIFNKTDLKAANALLGTTTERWDELTAAVENSAGACEDMYAIQLDNLNGDIDILKSGLADLGISIYKDLNGPLRKMTQLGTSMVGELSEAYKSGGMEGMVGAVGGCLSEVVNEIASYAPKVVGMGISLLENLVGGITANSGQIAGAAADVLTIFVEGLFTLVPQVILAGIDIITQLVQSITAQLPQLITSGTQAIVNFVNGIIQRLPAVITTALTLVQTLVNSIGQNAPMLIAAAIQLIGSLIMGLISMLPQIVQMGIQLIQGLVQGIVASLPLMLNMAVQIIVSLVNGLVTMLPSIIQGGIQIIISLIQGIIGNLGNIVQAAVQIVMAIITGLLTAIPQLITAIPQLISAIIDTLFSTDWAQVGMDILEGIANGITSMAKSFGSSVKNAVLDLFGMGGESGSDNTTSAAQTGQAVALDYANGITGSMGAVSTAAGSLSSTAFSSLEFTAAAGAGTNAGMAFNSSLSESMSGFTIDTSAMGIDTTNLMETMGTAGIEGMAALGTSISDGATDSVAAVDGLGTDITASLDGAWSKAQSSARTAMNNLVSTVSDAAHTAVSEIKTAFANMIIAIPKPKLPEIHVSYDTKNDGSGGSVKVPKFDVAWNALGGIFDQPTIFNTPAGMQGVGEKGPEAILPLDTLWVKMKEILNEAIAASGGASIIDAFIEKLKGIGTGSGGNTPELAGAGGPTIQYNPVYNLYGSAGKEEVAEADRISQAEFNKLMKQYERDRQRRKL